MTPADLDQACPEAQSVTNARRHRAAAALDPAVASLPTLLAEARRDGIALRLSGAHIAADHLEYLRPELRAALRSRREELWQLLGGAAAEQPPLELLAQLNIAPVVPQTEAEALALIAEIEADSDRVTPPELRDRPGLVGLDIETMALPGMEVRDPIKLTMKGLPHANQADFKGTAALNPHQSVPRLVQLYGGGARCLVLDTRLLPISLLGPVLQRRTMVIHNAAFELAFLTGEPPAAGLVIPYFEDTLQASALLLGVRRRGIDDTAMAYLGVELPKTLQTSDWGAVALSPGQIAYAAIDSITAFWLWLKMRPDLLQKGRYPAYELQRDVTPVAVRMMQRGITLDREAHAEKALEWARALADARHEFTRTTGLQPPTKPEEKRDYLRSILSETELQAWPRTPKGGHLSLAKPQLEYMAHLPAIQAMLNLSAMEKLLTAFGETLASKVSIFTGRLHPTIKIASTKTGRSSASEPNIQQIPTPRTAPGVRDCFVARDGYTLIAGDYSAMELRAAAAISGDPAWTADFAAGVDPHQRQAAATLNLPEGEVSKAQRDGAKPINFGVIYGSGARGLAASAWNNYGIRITIEEAYAGRSAFFRRYPRQLQWMEQHAAQCSRQGRIEIGRLGRVIEAAWEQTEQKRSRARRGYDEDANGSADLEEELDLSDVWADMHGGSHWQADEDLKYTLCCNAPIQGSCADAGMRALITVEKALLASHIDGALIAFLHDELLLEIVDHQVEQAREILTRCMTEAFAETFPDAPLNGLVATNTGKRWGKAKP